MGQELHPSPSPATFRPPEQRAVVQLVACAVFFAIVVGAIFFMASTSMRTLLVVGLGLFLVELVSVLAVTAVSWQRQVRGYPLVVFTFGWLALTLISGTCLFEYALLATYPPSPSLLQGLLRFPLAFAPTFVTVAAVLLADKVHRWHVSRRAGRT